MNYNFIKYKYRRKDILVWIVILTFFLIISGFIFPVGEGNTASLRSLDQTELFHENQVTGPYFIKEFSFSLIPD